MRSAIGPVLVLLGLATTLVLVLLLVQNLGFRGDLDRTREEVATLRAEVAQQEQVTPAELRRELDELESSIIDRLAAAEAERAGGGDVGTPAGGSAFSDLVDQLDEVLERITALDRRVDEICRGVPVC